MVPIKRHKSYFMPLLFICVILLTFLAVQDKAAAPVNRQSCVARKWGHEMEESLLQNMLVCDGSCS